jgi:hypothetical protein
MSSSWMIQQRLAGKGFFGSTAAAGVAIPLTTATAQVFGMWNPPGSGVVAVFDKLLLGIATLGTNIVAALNWSVHLNVQAIATGSALTALTETTIRNSILGRGAVSKVKFTGSAATTTAATQLLPVGITSTTGTPTNSSPMMVLEHDGVIMVPEATAIFLVGSAAPGSTYQIGLSWAEIPFTTAM